MSKVKKKSKK